MAKPAPITIPTEPIGSIPRPVDLIERIAKGDREDPSLASLCDDTIRDTIERFETKGSPASLLVGGVSLHAGGRTLWRLSKEDSWIPPMIP